MEIISCNSIPTACPNNIIENTNPIPNGIYHASSSVLSSGGVSGSGIVEMKAGNFIQLDAPFEVDLGGVFHAYIEMCDNTIPEELTLNCPTTNFVQDNCSYTLSWTHSSPLSNVVNYDLRINGIDPGPSVTYPSNSISVDLCNVLGINSGSGNFTVELLYWYDGDFSNHVSAGTCTINYNYGNTDPPASSACGPNSYQVDPNFDVQNLPTAIMRQAHADWWTSYQNPIDHFEDPPSDMFSAAELSNPDRNGSYSYARAGSHFLMAMTELIRTTCDPNALTELIFWSQQLRSNLKDHDGRGYDYFEYTAVIQSNPVDNKHNLDDTNWLDECMLGGTLAHIAWVMHQNRNFSASAGVEADFWFDYLDNNFIPKWNYRSTFGRADEITPAASLGLQNAVNWDGGVGGSGGNAGDITLWAGPDAIDSQTGNPRFNDFPGCLLYTSPSPRDS